MYSLPANTSDDIKYFSTLIDEFYEGKIEPVKFKAIRVPMGIYEQRKDNTYMVRIRCAGGFITPLQLKKVTEIAYTHGSQLIHITTRQEIQIQNLELKETLLVLQNLKEIKLSSKGGGGNTVRNILASVDSGLNKEETFDVLPYVFDLTTRLIAQSDSFTLPRKFKIAFSNSEEDTGFAKFNDLGFIAREHEDKRGFGVFIGGSLGNKPMIGHELFEFTPEEDLYYIAEAAKIFFSQHGNRKNKHKARLRHVFYKLGKEEVFRLFFEIYNELKTSTNLIYSPSPYNLENIHPLFSYSSAYSPDFTLWKKRYATTQKQDGYWTVIVPFEHGNINYAVLAKIADFAAAFGIDTIRFSMSQNLHLRNIPEEYLGNLFFLLVSLQVETKLPLILNTLVSCTGADTCRLGICLTKGASNALKRQLSKSELQLDKLSDLRINISGCPNSCGQQIAADLGFFGKVGRNDRMYPAYHVVAGASVGTNPQLAKIIGEVSAYDLPRFTIDVLKNYLDKTDKSISFHQYMNETGKEDISSILAKYAIIPEFSEDKNYYFDWGADQLFSLTARGVGECSAGLFDMIDVDLNTIQQSVSQLEQTTQADEINKLLYTITFASSRMLLITRGEEPKTVKHVFEAFIKKFIDDKLVSNVFREIVEMARENDNYNFIPKRETIIELSQTVIKLYESMDDSLQFKNIGNTKESENLKPLVVQKRNKDFRGVACPMNFVKTKIELSSLNSGDILEILLDDGAPIQNVPGSVRSEGHKVLDERKVDDYWLVVIEKT